MQQVWAFRSGIPTIRNKPVGKLLAVVGESAGRPTVNLCIRGIKVDALVDTGASCNLPRRDIFLIILLPKHIGAPGWHQHQNY